MSVGFVVLEMHFCYFVVMLLTCSFFYSVLDVPSAYNFDLLMQASGIVESWLCASSQYALLTLF